MKKFGLGPSSVDLDSIPSFSRPSRSCRKRLLSQSKLDSFFSPNNTMTSAGAFSLSDSFLSMPSAKKRRPSSASKSKNKTSAKRKLSKGTSKAPSSARKKKDRRASKTALTTPNLNIQSPSSKVPRSLSLPLKGKSEALKVLQKAKKFKQMDLKNSMVKKSSLTPIQLAELKLNAEFEQQRRAALLEEDKQRRKEMRMRKIREQQEQRRLEKLRQKELLKPREDLLCEDSKVSSGLIKRDGGGGRGREGVERGRDGEP